ncbi:DUF4116 domain-containing protein [Variovorax sp. RA8]|uniref:DUF4116 domain-containing protein n=1 Tax=Variovorax sp. (strain JCM 16519 / RA8) TaxID=662548 RepID=UPI0013A5AB57|nr:DUF4116 domain-containing protein [Variovorax sp. RA8]
MKWYDIANTLKKQIMAIQYKNKEEAIQALNNGAKFWTKGFVSFQDEPEVAFAAIKNHPQEVKRLSEALQTEEFACKLMRHSGQLFQILPEKLRENRNVTLAAIESYPHSIAYTSTDNKADKAIVLRAVEKAGSTLSDASKELQKDSELFHLALKTYGWALVHGTEADKANEKTVLKAIKIHPHVIRHASQAIQDIVGDSETPADTLEKYINARDLHAKLNAKHAVKPSRAERGPKI